MEGIRYKMIYSMPIKINKKIEYARKIHDSFSLEENEKENYEGFSFEKNEKENSDNIAEEDYDNITDEEEEEMKNCDNINMKKNKKGSYDYQYDFISEDYSISDEEASKEENYLHYDDIIFEDMEEKKYDINKEEIGEKNKYVKLKIFGSEFVKNNKNKTKLIIDNKKHSIKEFLLIREIKDGKLKVNLTLSKDLSNISYMFEYCRELLKLTIHNLRENNFEDNDSESAEFQRNDNLLEDNINANDHPIYKICKTNETYMNYSTISKKEEIRISEISKLLEWNNNLTLPKNNYISLK